METGYQRGKIQDESMLYEQRKHDGTLPRHRGQHLPQPDPAAAPDAACSSSPGAPRRRSSPSWTGSATSRQRHREEAHAALAALKEAARAGGNVFAVLMDAARVCSLQQITEAFFEVGGQYRRNV